MHGIVGALDASPGTALGHFWSNAVHNVVTPVAAVVASPFTAGASLALIRGKKYAQQKVLTKGVANVAIPAAAVAGAVILTVATAGLASPTIGLATGALAAGIHSNTQNQAASAAQRQEQQAAATQQQAAVTYATAHPVLSLLESWWAEYPTAIMAGAGVLALAAIIRAAKS